MKTDNQKFTIFCFILLLLNSPLLISCSHYKINNINLFEHNINLKKGDYVFIILKDNSSLKGQFLKIEDSVLYVIVSIDNNLTEKLIPTHFIHKIEKKKSSKLIFRRILEIGGVLITLFILFKILDVQNAISDLGH